jgi:aspartyl protease family protein
MKENEERIPALKSELRQLRQMLPRAANNVNENNRIVAAINNYQDELEERQKLRYDPNANKEVRAKVSQAREKYVSKLLGTRAAVDRAAKIYKELSADEAVTKALAAVNEDQGKKLELGPSKTFASKIKALEKMEALILTDQIQLTRGRGTYDIEVVLNGKYTKTFIFDTGASNVSIPETLANEIGLKADASTQPINVHIADGSTVTGKLMKIESIRVGKFVVENVDCIVMPLQNAPALLGGAFLNNFNYKLDPSTSKLELSKIGDLSGDKKETKGKAAKKPVKKKPATEGDG